MITICQLLDKDTGNLPALMRAISNSEEVKNAPKSTIPVRLTSNYQSMLWENQMRHPEFCYFWKDRERRFLGASKSFFRYYGFSSLQDILGKTDEDMGWHVEDGPYRDAELEVLAKGITVRNQPGQCILRGVLHHITCYKWLLYDRGQIVGLMGVFFDALFTYDEQKTLQKRRYSVLLLDNSTYQSVGASYGPKFAQQLLREAADTLRKTVGRDSTIARIRESTFAVLSYEKTEAEAEERAQVILRSLQTIHKVGGSPVTLAYHYAIAHSTEQGVSAKNIYHVAQTRLQDAPEKTGTKRR